MQGYSIPKTLILLLISFILKGGLQAAPEKTSDVAVLIDRSLSLEPENRDEALQLIEGILSNQVPATLSGKWAFISDKQTIGNPDTLSYRRKLQDDLKAALRGSSGDFAIPSPRLLLGSIGDLDTVLKLRSADWKTGKPSDISAFGSEANPSDPETHSELGRAIISARLKENSNYLLFVVSDGVEDLRNESVSFYLDLKKLEDKGSLEKADFLNDQNIFQLNKQNPARKRGETLTRRNGKKLAGYNQAQRKFLSDHRSGFNEILVGKFALSPDHLATFFKDHPKKVPVFVEVYRTVPKPNLTVSFKNPANSSAEAPHILAQGNSNITWSIEKKNDTLKTIELTVAALDAAGKPSSSVFTKNLQTSDTSLDLIKEYPQLSGTYQLTLTANTGKGLTERAAAYIQYIKPVVPVPDLVFKEKKFVEADKAEEAFKLRDLGVGFTAKSIAWIRQLDGRTVTTKPKSLEWVLQPWNLDRNLPSNNDSLEGKLSKNASKILIADLISSSEDGYFPYYGDVCRLSIIAKWDSGSRSEAVTFLRFPELELQILGEQKESEDTPRIVKKDQRIKIGNWMHPEDNKTISYFLDLESWQDGKWVNWEGENGAVEPLKIVHDKKGAYISIVDQFDGRLRYTVSLKYLGGSSQDEDEEEDGLMLTDTEGYVEYESVAWLPYIVGGFALLALLLFFWNLKSRRG